MESQNKLYKQFKDAASKVESKDFPAIDKVWGNLEEKLDKNALKKENKNWKKFAVAASILLVGTIGYQFLNTSENEEIIPQNKLVTIENDKIKTDSIFKNTPIVTSEPSQLIKENAAEIINKNLNESTPVAVTETYDQEINDSIQVQFSPKSIVKNEEKENLKGYFSTRKLDAISVKSAKRAKDETSTTVNENEKNISQEKEKPLVVIDGKAVKSQKNNFFNDVDIESVEYLSDPLYIINGVQYTEKQLFGPNPSSPYYPLNKQDITSTTILQGESATNLYGEKGKKGVVIISTKNKKPAKQ